MTVRRIGSGAPWEAVVGYSRAVVVGDRVWVSGTTGTVDGVVVAPGDAAAQTRQALANTGAALAEAGATLADVVRTRVHVTDISRWEEVGRAHGEWKDLVPLTPRELGASPWTRPMLVEVEADAVIGAGS